MVLLLAAGRSGGGSSGSGGLNLPVGPYAAGTLHVNAG